MLDEKTFELMSNFQRFVVSGDTSFISPYSLETLQRANQAFGSLDIDAPFRIALRDRIEMLKNAEVKGYEKRVRWAGFFITFILGIIATLLTQHLSK